MSFFYNNDEKINESITIASVATVGKIVATCLSIIVSGFTINGKIKEFNKNSKIDYEEVKNKSIRMNIKTSEQFIMFLSKNGKYNLEKLKASNKFKQMLRENNIQPINFYWKEKLENNKDENIILIVELFDKKYSKDYNWMINVIKRSLSYDYQDLMKFWKVSMKTDDNHIIIKSQFRSI